MHSIKSKELSSKLLKNSLEKAPETESNKIKTNLKTIRLPNYQGSMPIKQSLFSTPLKLPIKEYSINSKSIGTNKTFLTLLNKVSIIFSPKLNDSFLSFYSKKFFNYKKKITFIIKSISSRIINVILFIKFRWK